MRHLHGALLAVLIGLGLLVLTTDTAGATAFSQTNLVSDIAGLATITDANLKNPWGVSESSTSPFWVSDQGTNLATLYRVTGGVVSKVSLEVAIPTTASGPQGPTGQVNNSTSSFLVNGSPASFIFADLNGTISAWNNSAGTTAQIEATTPGAVYIPAWPSGRRGLFCTLPTAHKVGSMSSTAPSARPHSRGTSSTPSFRPAWSRSTCRPSAATST